MIFLGVYLWDETTARNSSNKQLQHVPSSHRTSSLAKYQGRAPISALLFLISFQTCAFASPEAIDAAELK
jgi:hypothetical protein